MQIKGRLYKGEETVVREKDDMELKDWGEFVHLWLSAGPYQLRSCMSSEIDPEKRINAILRALHKEDKESGGRG